MFDDYDVLWEEEMRVWEQEREEREWREWREWREDMEDAGVEDAGVGGNVVLNRAPVFWRNRLDPFANPNEREFMKDPWGF